MTESERLEAQARSFEFYAGLIEKAVGRGARLPVWDKMTAEDYRRQAQDFRRRAALLAEREKAREDKTLAEPSLPSR